MVDNSGNIYAFNIGNTPQKTEKDLLGVLTKYGHGNLINDSYNEFIQESGTEPSAELERAYKRNLTLQYESVDKTLKSASQGDNANNPIIQELAGHLIPSKERAFKSRATQRAGLIQENSADFLGENKPSAALNVANLISPELLDIYGAESNDYTAGLDERAKQIIETTFSLDDNLESLQTTTDQEAKLLYLCRVSEELKSRIGATEFLSKETGLEDHEKYSAFTITDFVNDELKPNLGNTALEQDILTKAANLKHMLNNANSPKDIALQEKAAIEHAPNVITLHND